jgi:hypothetical protein
MTVNDIRGLITYVIHVFATVVVSEDSTDVTNKLVCTTELTDPSTGPFTALLSTQHYMIYISAYCCH